MSNLCSTIVGYWHRLLPQREPANEGAARVEPSGVSETVQTSSERIRGAISEGAKWEGYSLRLWMNTKWTESKSLQNQAIHETVDERPYGDIFVCLVHLFKVASEQIMQYTDRSCLRPEGLEL